MVCPFYTLYQAIDRLTAFHSIQEREKVLFKDNRVRIYFGITETGPAYLEKRIEAYTSFTRAVDQILSRAITP